ncbi:DUF2252 domain-containing protein [Corynebacterium terpenotabidum]|uniref:DUF2252 domain-containing protein n=1 Tax=Corynebacterium terpenotabidum Y-11 TaxID=1200352 RepID=S4XKG6_9CORY|nr:DUF2252 domain-containing protein [Corynebacterium terpenotabidum]AGP31068.1 hypothetical protein A606_07105 [Corynebacterium terpenotabidum Y-11]
MTLSVAERIAAGRALRQTRPRAMLARLSDYSRDPLWILDEQNSSRLPELLPLRAERMSQSPFAFYRGTAAIMAADLAADAHTGIIVPSCGDAHVANFGFYASPQRTLVFDLNDFDEAAWAPWEWDLKRLVTSIIIAGQSGNRTEAVIRNAVLKAVRSYAATLSTAVGQTPLERFYTHFDAHAVTDTFDPASQKVLNRATDRARKRTGDRAARRLTTTDAQGCRQFIEQHPTMVRLGPELQAIQRDLVSLYLDSTTSDIRLLLQHYDPVDVIRRVVGVGSVGTRCSLSLFEDAGHHALILQSKEAGPSVLEQYGGITQPGELTELVRTGGQGARVVAMQRVLQALSDPFLGSLRYSSGTVGDLDLYVRQFHDMKGSIDADVLDDVPFVDYGTACAVTLARAHAQCPEAVTVSGYIGRGVKVGEMLLEWGYAYAERSRADFDAFVAAQQ